MTFILSIMTKCFFAALLLGAALCTTAQNLTPPYGKVDIADIELKECPYEKDAKGMVLFDKGDIYFDHDFAVVGEFHKRIKIFSEKAKDEANIRIENYNFENFYQLDAQTINYKDGKPVITRVDKKQVFTEVIDKNRTAHIFSFPDVQEGSIIEYKYKIRITKYFSYIPTWRFQSTLPCRYSELSTGFPEMLEFRTHFHIKQPFFKNKKSSESRDGYRLNTNSYALQNVPSLPQEPFMTSKRDNLQSVVHQLVQIRPINGFMRSFSDSWNKITQEICELEDFGGQLKKKIPGDDLLLEKVKTLKSVDQKISYLFNEVKNSMKWEGYDTWDVNQNISKAWEKKIGNATEINLILYRLLKEANIPNVYPLLVSTREHGRFNIAFPSLYQFNRTAVYVSIDSTTRYFLDASDKFNVYNIPPRPLLNGYGLSVDRETKSSNLVFIENSVASRKSVFVKAELHPDGKMTGRADITNFSYHKINDVEKIKKDGEDKFKQELIGQNNNLKITSLEIKGTDTDSIPIHEAIQFSLNLPQSDDKYLYFNPNLFSAFTQNPFLNENRVTTIDFGFNSKHILTGSFKVPAGFSPEGLPANYNVVMPDKSISFQRIMIAADGVISVRYVIDFKKSIYTTDDYPMLRQFYKQMFEMLNEQIVLKKS